MNQLQDYIGHGFALIPIPAGAKGPQTTGWNLAEDAVTNVGELGRIIGNVGLAHAYCLPFPTAAVDIDDVAAASDWLKGRGHDLTAMLDAPDAVQIISGRPNRAKLLYQLPFGATPLTTKQISDSEAGQMILEFRCASANGRTMQDVLPPSLHPESGQEYKWGGRGDWRRLPIMPESLVASWQRELDLIPQAHAGDQCVSKTVDDTPRRRAIVAEMLAHISPDCSYDHYRNIVWAILSLGWVDSRDLAHAWAAAAAHRFDEGSFQAVTGSFDVSRGPTFGTIHHFAKLGGWA